MSAAATPLGFTWLRVNGEPEPGAGGLTPAMYVDAAEVAAYLRQYEAADVADALDQLVADNPPPTTSGTLLA